jgi:hypothetical protein
MRTRSLFLLLLSVMLLVAGCDFAGGSSGGEFSSGSGGGTGGGSEPPRFRQVVVALSQARNADERAIIQIAKTTGTGSTCYATAADQYMGAAASYNAWISDMVASIQQGNSITELDLKSIDLQRAAAYSALLRKNATLTLQSDSATFGSVVRTISLKAGAQRSLPLCPFVTGLARVAVEAAVGELVSQGLGALVDSLAGDNDQAQRDAMIRQLEERRWYDLSMVR